MKLNAKKDIKPLFNYVIIRPFDVNPYKTRVTESGIVLALGNTAHSQETGEQEKLEQRIKYGIVMEIGPDVKHIEIGDEVYYDSYSASPLPILDLGFHRTNEANILAHVRGEGDSIAEAIALEAELQKKLEESAVAASLQKSGIII